MANKNITPGSSFTATFDKVVRAVHTFVELESAIKPADTIKLRALWDTGATSSMIRPEVAKRLNLPCFSKALYNTPSGKDVASNVYLVHILLPNHAKIVNVQVLEGTPNGCDMIIGMDVISLGDLALTNYDSRTTFSFRIPSMTKIDFCKHSHIMPVVNNSKIGRNDLCPCGSGKKFKFCCGKEDNK